MGSAFDFSDAAFKKASEEGKTVIVDFSAEWCGPCQHIKPLFSALAEEHDNLVFFKCDVDIHEDFSQKQKVTALPTFKAFKNGEAVGEVMGASEKALRAFVGKHA